MHFWLLLQKSNQMVPRSLFYKIYYRFHVWCVLALWLGLVRAVVVFSNNCLFGWFFVFHTKSIVARIHVTNYRSFFSETSYTTINYSNWKQLKNYRLFVDTLADFFALLLFFNVGVFWETDDIFLNKDFNIAFHNLKKLLGFVILDFDLYSSNILIQYFTKKA